VSHPESEFSSQPGSLSEMETVINTVSLLKKYFGENWLKLIENIKIVSIGPQTSISCTNLIRKPDKEANPHDLEGLLKACLELNYH